MTNAKMVFETAMAIMDNLSQPRGEADTAENREYKDRTLPLLNSLTPLLCPYSDSGSREDTGRPVPDIIENFEMGIGLDDFICRSVLPYGLASALLINEDPESAAWCERKFNEMKEALKTGVLAEAEDISDLYGGYGHGEFSSW